MTVKPNVVTYERNKTLTQKFSPSILPLSYLVRYDKVYSALLIY